MPPVLCRVKRLPGTASREEFQAYLQSLAQGRGVEVIEWNHGTALLRCPSKKAKDRLNQAFRSTPFKTVKLVAEKLPPTSSSAAAGGDGDETQSHPTQDIRKVAFAGEGCTCRVGGIKKSLRGEFEKYLSTKVETDLLLVKFLQHKKTLSAILRVENEEAVRRLNAEFQEKLFAKAARVAHIVPTDSLTHTDTWVALDTPEEQAYVEAKGLAKGFHEYLVDRPDLLEQAADRDRLGEIFHLFYSGPEKMQGRKMESYVLARMREMKLLKSKRVGDQVVVLIANRDKTFPTLGEKKDFVADQRRLAGENKGGVEVSGVEIDFAQVDEKTELPFDVSSNDPTVVLTALNLSGAKPKAFQLASIALPTPLNKSLRVPLIFHPKNIGCYHAILDFVFESSSETFSIKRFLTLRAGNKVLDAILKPESPFKRRVPHVYSKKFSEVIDAPSSGHKSDKNPFKKLPQFTVPPQIKSLLMNHEFEGAIKRPVDSCGYGDFWKKMLWASELQAFQDIQLFDMEDTSLKREGRFFSLTVPGLAEGRPSVLRGDLVHVTWNNRLYKGRVQSTRLLEVILEFDRAFEKFNPGLDRVDVRFTFSRMTYRTR